MQPACRPCRYWTQRIDLQTGHPPRPPFPTHSGPYSVKLYPVTRIHSEYIRIHQDNVLRVPSPIFKGNPQPHPRGATGFGGRLWRRFQRFVAPASNYSPIGAACDAGSAVCARRALRGFVLEAGAVVAVCGLGEGKVKDFIAKRKMRFKTGHMRHGLAGTSPEGKLAYLHTTGFMCSHILCYCVSVRHVPTV